MMMNNLEIETETVPVPNKETWKKETLQLPIGSQFSIYHNLEWVASISPEDNPMKSVTLQDVYNRWAAKYPAGTGGEFILHVNAKGGGILKAMTAEDYERIHG